MENKFYIVGISGGSGSGKTYFLNRLLNGLPEEDVCLISQDNYYKAREDQPLDEKGISNFDLPESIDFNSFNQHLCTLIRGEKVHTQEYTFNNKDSEAKTLILKPALLIIIEGLFVFHDNRIADRMDLRLFVEANPIVKMKRRILRDNKERGYGLDDVLYRYEKHVYPAYKNFIEPYKDSADIIIPNHKDSTKGMDVIINHLRQKLTELKHSQSS